MMSGKTLVRVVSASVLGAAVMLFVVGSEDSKSFPRLSTPLAPGTGTKVSPQSASEDIERTSSPGTTKISSMRRTLVSLEMAEARPAGEEPEITVEQAGEGDKVAIFVYDGIPELDHTDLIQCYRDSNDGVPPWQDERIEMAQNMGEIWMHRAMLSHPWRVLDPEEADLFYIPMYPVLSMKLALAGARPWEAEHLGKIRCGGLKHTQRMDKAVDYLSRSSPFFNRFGGADHVLVCAWWDCREALGPKHRMLLRRTVIGVNERVFDWTRWGCGPERTVAVPYTASSILTTPEAIGGRAAEDRDISFLFVGTARDRPERQNLDIVKSTYEDSVILLGEDESDWGMNSTVYAEHVSRSRFCFCPRGDTESSRHFVDAIAGGCIPIVTQSAVSVLPFSRSALDYSKFAVVVGNNAFKTREDVANVARDARSRSDEDLAELRRGGTASMTSILYGVTEGPELSDMRPFLGTATKFVQESYALARGREGTKESMWNCPETDLPADILAPRTEKLPPEESKTERWLTESETMVNVERSLLFCAPPNTGSLQFRMLAKRMQGIRDWSVHNNWSLLFDPAASGLELLDLTDEPLMTKIYSDNGSGWIKIGVVRDPVTRLLSAYLDLVDAWRAECVPPLPDVEQATDHDRRQLQQVRQQENSREEEQHRGQGRSQAPLASEGSEWGLFDAILCRRRRRHPCPEREGYTGYENNVSEGFHHGGGGVDGDFNIYSSTNCDYHRCGHHLPQELKRQEQQQQRRQLNDATAEYPFPHRPRNGKKTQFFWEGPGGWYGPGEVAAKGEWAGREGKTSGDVTTDNFGAGDAAAGDDSGIHIPTFLEVVEALEADIWNAPAAFRPAVSLCGQQYSPFDSVIPFERLQRTSTEVIKSLPGDIWDTFGKSGWGPDGDHAFMEFDYGEGPHRTTDCALLEREPAADAQANDDTAQREEEKNEDHFPRRASDLFEGQESCAWVEYYSNMETLEAVGKIYEMDYRHYRWYRLDPWRERLKACLDN